MKALLTLALIFSFAQASLANLNGVALEMQQQHLNDNHVAATKVGSASLKELGRSQSKTEMSINFLADSDSKTELLSVLHESNTLTLTMDLSQATSNSTPAKVQILGDDDQIRKAEGSCTSLEGTLHCTTVPSFNAYGLLENTFLVLSLK